MLAPYRACLPAVAASTVAAARAAVYGMVAAIDVDGGDDGGSGRCDGVGGSRRSCCGHATDYIFSCGLYYRNETLLSMAFQRVRVIEEALSVT